MSDDYEIGYRKPPRNRRFQPGQSGNPKGRPKGRRNFRTEVEAILMAPVPIKENGRVRHVPTQVAALMRLREKALNGDSKALQTILTLADQVSERQAAQEPESDLSLSDKAIVEEHLAKLKVAEGNAASRKIRPKGRSGDVIGKRKGGGRRDV